MIGLAVSDHHRNVSCSSHATRHERVTKRRVVARCDAAGTGTGNSRLIVTYEIAWIRVWRAGAVAVGDLE